MCFLVKWSNDLLKYVAPLMKTHDFGPGPLYSHTSPHKWPNNQLQQQWPRRLNGDSAGYTNMTPFFFFFFLRHSGIKGILFKIHSTSSPFVSHPHHHPLYVLFMCVYRTMHWTLACGRNMHRALGMVEWPLSSPIQAQKYGGSSGLWATSTSIALTSETH